jgi:hypothetical protein
MTAAYRRNVTFATIGDCGVKNPAPIPDACRQVPDLMLRVRVFGI